MATVEDFIAEKLEEIDEQIRKIDNHKIMRAAQKLIEDKSRLMAARRALLGAGSKTTSSGGSRVTQGEVVAFFERNADKQSWWTVEEIASAMGHTPEVIRGHLNRGKNERFVKDNQNQWALRDPETQGDEDDEE